MEQKKKFVAFIPLRGGSKSIPLKNIKKLSGKPLAYWTIEAALNCEAIEMVYVSTDSKEISEIVASLEHEKLKIIDRSPETATDTASTESALLEFAERYTDNENIVLIQATSPLLESDDLQKGIQLFKEGNYDSLLSVVRQKRFIWKVVNGGAQAQNYEVAKRPRRQEFEGYFVENGAFYVMSRAGLLEHKNRLFGTVGIHEMSEETFIELDEAIDWTIVEHLLTERKKKLG